MGVEGVETVEVGTVKPPDDTGVEAIVIDGLYGGTEDPSAEDGAIGPLAPPGLKGSSSAPLLWYEPLGEDGWVVDD